MERLRKKSVFQSEKKGRVNEVSRNCICLRVMQGIERLISSRASRHLKRSASYGRKGGKEERERREG